MNNEIGEIIEISHGGGGKRMDLLIKFLTSNIGLETFNQDIVGPNASDDSAVLPYNANNIVITTDSHTVDPIFFRGGNISDLSICGTVNDLTVMGAVPKYLTFGLIIEEGYKIEKLQQLARTLGDRCREANVRIVAGDTKVMPRGMISEIVMNTAGVGTLVREAPIQDAAAKSGDSIIITAPIGVHGTSLMSLREGIEFDTDLASDVASFWPSFENVIKNSGVHAMKDLTRGGMASGLSEIALKSNVCLEIYEDRVPIKEESQAICDILGLEIFEISGEGCAVIIVDNDNTDEILNELKTKNISKYAVKVGTVKESPKGKVHVITEIGGTRILDKPYGEPIPRVC
ncbi:MAG: Hydrogenase isoenzymes formation protein HypE [Candidatus Heimdallarchaeota archaeon LC_2]|nr:MAG: Hydrogenase isoenzymes formation protein HypE [Candidatus Heimdallarchaeota archaeon LC_2]